MMCIALHFIGWNLNISINSLFKLYSEFGTHAYAYTYTCFWVKSIFLRSICDDLRSRLHWCDDGAITTSITNLTLELLPVFRVSENFQEKNNNWQTNERFRNKMVQYRVDQFEICMSFPHFYYQLFSFLDAEYLQLIYWVLDACDYYLFEFFLLLHSTVVVLQNHLRVVYFSENCDVD